MLLSFYLRFNNHTRCAPDEHQTPVVRRLQQDGHLCAWWRPGGDIHAKLIARAKFSGPASRLGEGIGQPPHSAACLAGIPRINWGFSFQLNRFKILINTDATGPRCSYELPTHSSWMQACGCHWWVPSTWRGVRLERVSLFLRKPYLFNFQTEIVRLINNVSIATTMNIFLYKNVVVQCKIGLDRNWLLKMGVDRWK